MGEHKRGSLGLAFFVSALAVMATLVATYDPPHQTSQPLPPMGTIEKISGLDGFPLQSVVQIQVDYTGEIGPVRYLVSGARAFEYVARQPPYLLDPHDPQIGGWDTAVVPDGEYTIIATSVWDPRVRRSARVIVQNQQPPPRGGTPAEDPGRA